MQKSEHKNTMKKALLALLALVMLVSCNETGGNRPAIDPSNKNANTNHAAKYATRIEIPAIESGDIFLSQSTCNTKETIEFEGETYPLIKLEISNTSHPFYTGKAKLVDTAGRVDKFMSRYSKTLKK